MVKTYLNKLLVVLVACLFFIVTPVQAESYSDLFIKITDATTAVRDKDQEKAHTLVAEIKEEFLKKANHDSKAGKEVQKSLDLEGEITEKQLVTVSTSLLAFEKEQNPVDLGQVTITTDDGSYGIKGYVSTVIDQMDQEFDAIYSCGAPGMLKYVNTKFHDHPRAYISMESRMACGMGACYACVVHLENESHAANKRVCEDGPVFETGKIVM